MSPEVIAATIAAGVSFLTLIGQYLGRRATSRQLDKTFEEQRTRTLNERFATAAEQLGSDKPTVRLAGVYAMAGLADDWAGNRQTCVEVLCAYLRMPYDPDPGPDVPEPQRLAFMVTREVRRTVIRVIAAHLRNGSVASEIEVIDRGAYVRIQGEGRLVLTEATLQSYLGADYRIRSLENLMSSFAGRAITASDSITWERAGGAQAHAAATGGADR